jgi:hypothetical protein
MVKLISILEECVISTFSIQELFRRWKYWNLFSTDYIVSHPRRHHLGTVIQNYLPFVAWFGIVIKYLES